jgi:hypothetical protein
VDGSVRNIEGAGVTGDLSIGSFTVDTVAPTATLTAAPTVDATDASGSTTTVTIAYTDSTPGVDTSTFGTGNITVSNGATVTGYSARGDAVTYTITARAAWGASTQGGCTIGVVAGSVKDLAGNGIAADYHLGSYWVTTVVPAASLTSAATITAAEGSGTTTTVEVTYSAGAAGIDTSTFGTGNITVNNGATVSGYSATGDVVTYTITSPSTNWSASVQGSYVVTLVGGSVRTPSATRSRPILPSAPSTSIPPSRPRRAPR